MWQKGPRLIGGPTNGQIDRGRLFEVKSRIIYSVTFVTTIDPSVFFAAGGSSLMMHVSGNWWNGASSTGHFIVWSVREKNERKKRNLERRVGMKYMIHILYWTTKRAKEQTMNTLFRYTVPECYNKLNQLTPKGRPPLSNRINTDSKNNALLLLL